MSKIITKAGASDYSKDAISRIQVKGIKYAIITGEAGGVQRINYFYPAPNGGYATIAGADRIGGKDRYNRALEIAMNYADHPANTL